MITLNPLPLKKTLLMVSVSTLVVGCASYGKKSNELSCEGHANYQVVFNSTWTAETHPEDFPEKPHYSHLFGITHNDDVSYWEPGSNVTDGVKNIAERGSGLQFIKEGAWSIKIDEALNVFDGNEMPLSPGKSEVQFQVTDEFPLITLVNMLAPSPDWITGVSSMSLCENGQWLTSKTVSADVYDAGTDDGRTYTAKDITRASKEPAVLLNESGRSDYATFPAVGTFEFTKIDTITNPEGAGYVDFIREELKK